MSIRRAVDLEGEVQESFVTKHHDHKAALKFLKKTMKRYGTPEVIVTDRLESYGAAMKLVGNAMRQTTVRRLNIRAENSHFPFGQRERVMLRFRQLRSLQKLDTIYASVHKDFLTMSAASNHISISN
jgi:putative transposase